jgi:pSer/pThr/pTyr-binding forkhead associated (FHA) protein
MAQPDNVTDPIPKAAVHLLDSALGRPMRSWQFDNKTLITIGRAEESDVNVSDPYVSRIHAELRYAAGKWTLVSLGRYGLMVKGEQITEMPLQGETVFRLGSGGPSLRFEPVTAKRDNRMTMMFDSTVAQNIFDVDERKVQQEVGEITDGSYFQELQKRAKQLRKLRE